MREPSSTPKISATYLDLGLTLKIERAGGKISELIINSADVKDLRFHRLILTEAMQNKSR